MEIFILMLICIGLGALASFITSSLVMKEKSFSFARIEMFMIYSFMMITIMFGIVPFLCSAKNVVNKEYNLTELKIDKNKQGDYLVEMIDSYIIQVKTSNGTSKLRVPKDKAVIKKGKTNKIVCYNKKYESDVANFFIT